MARFEVTNGDHRSKAVLVAGGHEIVAPGATETVKANWSEGRLAAYRKSGLVINEVAEEPPAVVTEDRDAVIRHLIAGLNAEEDFLEDGRPDVRKINAAAEEGFEPVSAAERDDLWEAMKAADE